MAPATERKPEGLRLWLALLAPIAITLQAVLTAQSTPAYAAFLPRPRVSGGTAAAGCSPSANIQFNSSGVVLGKVQVVEVLWGTGTFAPFIAGTDANGHNLAEFYSQIVNSPYIDQLAEYQTGRALFPGPGTNDFLGVRRITPVVSTGSTLSLADVFTELRFQMAMFNAQTGKFNLPGESGQTIYMVHFPREIHFSEFLKCIPDGGKAYAIHTSQSTQVNGTVDGVPQTFYYTLPFGFPVFYPVGVFVAMIPDFSDTSPTACYPLGGADPWLETTDAASHELVETITDPFNTGNPLTGWSDPATSNEIADVCGGCYAASYTGTDCETYEVAPYWSQAQSTCVPTSAISRCNALAGPLTAISPVPGAGCQDPNAVSLVWSGFLGALRYRVRVSASATCGQQIIYTDSTVGTSIALPSLASGTEYSWTIDALNAAGAILGSSACATFATAPAAPSAPTALSPGGGVSNQPVQGSLTWQEVNGATSYRVSVACRTCGAGTPVISDSLISHPPFVYALPPGQYSWHVTASNDACPASSSVSATDSFTVMSGLSCAAATPLTPQDGTNCGQLTGLLTWSSIAGAKGYYVELGQNRCNGKNAPGPEVHVAANQYAYANLQPRRVYYWRIRPDSPCGQYGPCASFTTESDSTKYQTVSLISPPNGAISQPPAGTLSWNAVSGAAGYELQLSTSCGDGPYVFVPGTSYLYSGLNEDTEYWWRVYWLDSCGQGGQIAACDSFHVERISGTDHLSVPAGLTYLPGQTAVPIPIWEENTGGIARAQVSVLIDPTVFDYQGLSLGGTRGSGASNITGQYNPTNGRLDVNLAYSATGHCPPSIPQGNGPLFNISATVRSTAPLGLSPITFLTNASYDTCAVGGTHNTHVLVVNGAVQIVGATTGVIDSVGSASSAKLQFSTPAPNPTTGGVSMRYCMPRAGRVRIDVVDVAGHACGRVLDTYATAGWHAFTWDANSASPRSAPSGAYFLRLTTDGRTLAQRLILLR